jgi:hypothetical protein
VCTSFSSFKKSKDSKIKYVFKYNFDDVIKDAFTHSTFRIFQIERMTECKKKVRNNGRNNEWSKWKITKENILNELKMGWLSMFLAFKPVNGLLSASWQLSSYQCNLQEVLCILQHNVQPFMKQEIIC